MKIRIAIIAMMIILGVRIIFKISPIRSIKFANTAKNPRVNNAAKIINIFIKSY